MLQFTTETPRSLAESKSVLKERVLSRCVHGNYTWVNPDIEATVRCCNELDSHSTLLAFYVLQTLVTTPVHQWLPVDFALTMHTSALRFIIQDDFLSCVSTEDLMQVLQNIVTVPEKTRLLFVRASVKTIVMRGHSKDLPPSMFDMPLANMVVQAGVPVETLQQIVSSGFPLQFPVQTSSYMFRRMFPDTTFRRMFPVTTTQVDPHVVRYVVETYGHEMPFERYHELSPHRVTCNQNIIYTLVTCGYQRVESPCELVTLIHNANTLVESESEHGTFVYNSFLTWLKENITNYPMIRKDLLNGRPPRTLELLEVLTSHLDSTYISMLVTDIIWDKWYSWLPMLLHLRSINAKPFGDDVRFLGLKLDPRIATYLRSTTGVQPPFIYVAFPDVTEETDMVVQFDDDLRVHVYSEFLARHSPVIKTLVNGGGFKRVLSEHGAKKVLTLETGLPEGLHDPKGAVKTWTTFCYTGALEASVTTNQVSDVKFLAQYLQDDKCEAVANKWMEYEYMTNREHYGGHDNDANCPVCCHWGL